MSDHVRHRPPPRKHDRRNRPANNRAPSRSQARIVLAMLLVAALATLLVLLVKQGWQASPIASVDMRSLDEYQQRVYDSSCT